MKRNLLVGVAAAALIAGPAFAQDNLMFTPGEGDQFTWSSYEEYVANAPDLSGETVTVAGPWLGPDKDLIESVLAYFTEATGATVEYAGSDSFEQQIRIDAQAGSAPNVAVFPQPGLLGDMAREGLVAPLTEEDAAWVAENYAAGQSWVDLATFDGELYGFFYKADVKSLVWFVPENFGDAGYEVPSTMEGLKELTDQIVADGGTPWCIGLGSGGATGWPATDWVEDMLLRTAEPAVYDQWVANEIPFDDPRIVAAIEEFGYFARNDDYVAGGAAAVATTDFRDSPKGLFSFPPECYMHRQASFIPAFFPEGTEVGLDVDFFYFPSYESKDLGTPVLGAGTVFGITEDSPGARALIDFLKTPIAHEVWMAQGGLLTAHSGVNTDAYVNDATRSQGQILLDATTFRFDASDLMPGGIGAGAFWTGMIDYAGGADAEEVAGSIQETWDALK
ncbi:ABC transporter substrate-binding protein [Pontivivens nitratireducens]|uniref:Carbohydrate ABC transporter substrate-binding protein n=1 Tax=Pontivivens nitratireducens TaxID=2758038 RepID=A0A6G7VHG5_9RHOB|nr:ABC transporter substrate-binding protein [Pontibrevibacter nitratireducens]QIK39288.1 carbohydrate ABC transporter substrate-binding protein [Pontibrevibacter nitratireducens]